MRISLRLKLALVSLLLLLFPVLGMRLNTILKDSLLTSQQDTLSLTAQAVSASLANRADLFSREQFHSLNQGRDLYLFQLSTPIQLDGSLDDWQPEAKQAKEFVREQKKHKEQKTSRASLSFRHLAGKQETYLYAFFEVQDDKVVFRNKKSLRLDRSDHLQIVIEKNGLQRKYLVTCHGPGWVNGYLMPDSPVKFPVIESHIQGVWQLTDRGYILEIRISQDILGSKLAFTIADVDDPITRNVNCVLGTADLKENKEPGWLLTTSSAIEKILHSLDRPYARIRVVDANQHARAQVGSLRKPGAKPKVTQTTQRVMEWAHNLLKPLYRFFTTSFSSDITDHKSQPTALDIQGIKEGLAGKSSVTRYLIANGQVEVMAAITPLYDQDQVVGAVVVEQTTNSILSLSNRLIEETLSLSVLAFLLGGGMLFLFAFRISARIRRLRNQAAASITDDGRVKSGIVTSRKRDEIGDLGRTLHSMLEKLKQQDEHREQMADNLEHEMRTPLAGVAASLKNLDHELGEASPRIREYLSWAEQDVMRLEDLLTSIREATTLRDALQQASQETFDLGKALSIWLSHGWQQTRPDVSFKYRPPEEAVLVQGDPVRLRQALDKLVENAVSFHLKDTAVEIFLTSDLKSISVQVVNQGGTIEPALHSQIFNSMVSSRKEKDAHPHLGLGLYIVRTIIQYHGGTVSVCNLSDGRDGVVFTMTFPVAENRD